jgi:hypothetical protein
MSRGCTRRGRRRSSSLRGDVGLERGAEQAIEEGDGVRNELVAVQQIIVLDYATDLLHALRDACDDETRALLLARLAELRSLTPVAFGEAWDEGLELTDPAICGSRASSLNGVMLT